MIKKNQKLNMFALNLRSNTFDSYNPFLYIFHLREKGILVI